MPDLFGDDDARTRDSVATGSGASDAATRFARVAVERSVDRYPSGLLYAAPEDLALAPGHRVLVPLGRGDSTVPGTIVDTLDRQAAAAEGVPFDRVKPILSRTDDLPPLPT